MFIRSHVENKLTAYEDLGMVFTEERTLRERTGFSCLDRIHAAV